MESTREKKSFARFVNCFKFEIFLLLYILYSLGRITFKLTVEVSQFKSIFASMNVELPSFTMFLLNLSDVVSEWWMVGLLPALALIGTLVTVVLVVLWTKALGDENSMTGAITCGSLIATAMFLIILEALMSAAIYLPMTKLVNSVG